MKAAYLGRAILFFLVVLWVSAAGAEVAIPPLSARVNDLTNTLTPEQRASLEQTLREYESRKGVQIGVLIVPTTAPEAIEQYALRVVEQWKLGRKNVDDGALLIVAKNDRAMRIEVGYGLEGVLNDAVSRRIISEIITPDFKQNNFYGGISAGIERMMRVVDGQPLPAAQSRGAGDADLEGSIPLIFIAALIIGGVLRPLLGRLPGAAVTAGLTGFLAWALAGAISIAVFAAVLALLVTLFGGGMRGFGGGYYGGGFGGRGSHGARIWRRHFVQDATDREQSVVCGP